MASRRIPTADLDPEEEAAKWDAWATRKRKRRRRKAGARRSRSRDYREHLSSPEWKHLRELVLERDRYACQRCGEPAAGHVHHLNYHRPPGCEDGSELVTVCAACHQAIHSRRRWWEWQPSVQPASVLDVIATR